MFPPVRTGLATDPLFSLHVTGPGHPERPERLPAILSRIKGLELTAVAPRDATTLEIEAAHTARYVAWAREQIETGVQSFDADTTVCADSYAAAVRAAGAGLALGEAWLAGEIEAGFACVRPPGHHACPEKPMGFCIFNNIAILARFLQSNGKRVCILDFDVHHGNGTQDILWNEPEIGFCSLHQMPLWPGSGARDETGAGNIRNIPMRPGNGDAEYLQAFDKIVVPWLDDRAPDVLLVSAGFDAHERDPLAQMNLSSEAYGEMTRRVLGRPILSLLEGGYDLTGLADGVHSHVSALIDG